MSFRNFDTAGPLLESLVTQWASNDPPSPLGQLPGFSIWRCMFDLMHTLDLGLAQRAVPSALQGLLGLPARRRGSEATAFPGRSAAERCKEATRAYHAWAKRTMVPSSARVKAITPRWFDGRWPTISQQHAKAAALRAMLPWVAELAETRQGESRAALLRARCLRGLVCMDKVYSRAPRFLSKLAEKEAMQHGVRALRAMAELEQLMPDGPWRLVPKAHALLHIVRDSAMGNPRVAHCYQDEDFVGRIKRAYVSCHGKTAPLRAIQRYCLAAGVSFTAREELLTGRRSKRAPPLTGGPIMWARRAGSVAAAASGSADLAAAADSSGRGTKRGRGRPRVHTVKRRVGRPRTRPEL